MRRRWTRSGGERSTAAWVTGVIVALGAAALVASAMPSARRYLRLRRM